MSLSLQLGLRLGLLSGGFSPASLFAAGESGYWLDPSDFSTMWQDSTGTTPVTATGQTVGLILDKSQGLVRGSDLVSDVQVDFTYVPSYVTSGLLVFNGLKSWSAARDASGHATMPAKVGSALRAALGVLEVSFTLSDYDGPVSGITTLQCVISDNYTNTLNINTAGTYTILVPQATALTFSIGNNGRGYRIDNLVVRQIAGNHFLQATAGNRPILGVEPAGGRRNLLTYTEQFDNAAWTKTNATVTANAAVAPDGTTTAGKIIATAVNASHFASYISVMGASPHTISCYMKAAEYTTGSIFLSQGGNVGATFDLSAGTVSSVSGTGNTATIQSVGSGWYRCSITNDGSADLNDNIRIGPADGAYVIYTGDGTSGIFIWGAQLETGTTATDYQRVTDQWNVTEAGVTPCYYLAFDGTDDFLQSAATINPGAVDKAQVFAGVRKLSDAAIGEVVGSSTAPTGLNGSFYLRAPSGVASANYQFRSRGTTNNGASYTNAAVAAPVTNVLTGLADISGPSEALRVNGVVVASNTLTQGTGNYLTYTHYIGRTGGTSNPYNGRVYQTVMRFGPNLDAAQIDDTEDFVAIKTGFFAPQITGVPTIS